MVTNKIPERSCPGAAAGQGGLRAHSLRFFGTDRLLRIGVQATVLVLLLSALTGCEPQGPKALIEGERLLGQGRAEESLRMLQLAVEKLPREARAWNLLGLAYHAAGNLPEAATAYGKALTLDHRLSAARFNLGSLLLEQGQVQAAVNELTAYTLLQRQDVNGWLRLGQAQMQLNRSDLADASYRTVLALAPRQVEALNSLGMVQVSRRRYVDAVQYFQAALAENPSYGPALLNQAIVTHRHLNQKVTALQKYRQYLALQPAPPNASEVQLLAQALADEIAGGTRPKSSGGATNPVPSYAGLGTLTSLPPAAVVVRTSPPPAGTASQIAKNPLSPAREIRPSSVPPSQTSTPIPPPVLPAVPAAAAPSPAKTPPVTVVASVAATAPPLVKDPVPEVVPVTDVGREVVVLPPQAIVPPRAEPANTVVVSEPPSQGPGMSVSSPKGSALGTGQDKRGFFSRMNPLSWGGRREPVQAPTQTFPTATPSNPVLRANPSVEPVAPAPLESGIPTTGYRRYTARSLPRPRAGDRAKAVELVNKGVIAHQERRFEEEIAFYRSASLSDPSSYDAYFNMGLSMVEQGNWPAGLQAYESALSIDPESISARYNLAVTLRQLDYPVDAGHALERILQSHPGESKALLALANLHAQKFKQPRLARQYYLRFLEADPQHPKASEVRFWLAANP